METPGLGGLSHGGSGGRILRFVEQVWQARIDLNLADEGLLWHYVQRTLAGEVPVRDFLCRMNRGGILSCAWALLVHSDGLIARCGMGWRC